MVLAVFEHFQVIYKTEKSFKLFDQMITDLRDVILDFLNVILICSFLLLHFK